MPRGVPGRRGVLGGLVTTAAAGCAPAAETPPPLRATAPPPAPTRVPDPTAAPTAVPTVPPAPTATPVPQPRLTRLNVEAAVQPLFAGDRILFYDQPPGGAGGTWAVDAQGAPRLERPQWGYYWAHGQLLATPRPPRRDTYVLDAPSGREWTLPTTNNPIFSNDATVVAYATAAQGQPGGAPPGPGSGFSGPAPDFVLSSVVLAGADGQGARTVQLPINGSVLAWLPAPDGTANARLLLSGRRAANDDPSLWSYDVRDRSLVELVRSRRLVGALPSPDGTWVAWVSMWNRDSAQDGLWVARTDASVKRRVELVGGYRWTDDNLLLVIPHRASHDDSHEVWSYQPSEDRALRLVEKSQLPLRVLNQDWDCAPDGRGLCFVSADDKSLWLLQDLDPARGPSGQAPPAIPTPPLSGTRGRPYRLPFATPPGPSTWYVSQWYGVTTGGYRGRNSTYVQGQGIHFGIDFATACSTEVVAIAAGTVIAVDGNYGSPPHNVVLQLPDGNQAVYGHLVERTRHVQVGQRVESGQVVGNSGDSIAPYNCTRNPHLHLEIRKAGRAVATNPVRYFDANWDDASLGVWPGPRFERDLDNPRRYQFPDDQPDIWFGGPILTNFPRPWPP